MITKKSPLQSKSIGTESSVAIRELPGLHTIDLRVAPGTKTISVIADALGMNLLTKPGQISMSSRSGLNETYVLCLAPDWWLMVGYPEAEKKLAPLQLTADFHFSITDVSGQRTTIELTGPNARDVLAHLWEQDLREKSFPIDSVSQGLMAKAPVIVCHMAPHRYRVMVRSSFAVHLWEVLVDAAVEWV
jgi:sarcosine oxidase, subunit gamma